MDLIKKTSRWIQSGFYLFAGANHFISPEFYDGLIPPYIPNHHFVNLLSGAIEIGLAIGLVIPKTRKISAILIIAMLVAFIPSHVYFIQIGGCIADGLCAPLWVGWMRLIVIHPLLIWWAWSARK